MNFLWIFSLIIGAIVSYFFYDRGRDERFPEESERRDTALVDPLALPCCLFFCALLVLLLSNKTDFDISELLISELLLLLIGIGVYYAILLCILPLLRRLFSARACATLWLLPNFLYLGRNMRNLRMGSPPLILTVPIRWLHIIGMIWAVGFASILLWQIVSHFSYRRFLLRHAVPVSRQELTILWEEEQTRCGRCPKKPIPIIVSAEAKSPLTIGIFCRTQRLVLPHLNYTPEEFRLIFRHEMHHIRRLDTRTKAFWGFCTALCWFNPLMWIARRKVSDDLELSCDELVLAQEDENTRRKYAQLLLNTAGSSKGYTTCLSAAASSLRYRLKNIVTPRKRFSGVLLVGLATALMFMGSAGVALADSPDTIAAQIFSTLPAGDLTLDAVTFYEDSITTANRRPESWDQEKLTEYLSGLPVRRVYSNADASGSGQHLIFEFTTKEHELTTSRTILSVYDDVIVVSRFFSNGAPCLFALDEAPDWDFLHSCLTFAET